MDIPVSLSTGQLLMLIEREAIAIREVCQNVRNGLEHCAPKGDARAVVALEPKASEMMRLFRALSSHVNNAA